MIPKLSATTIFPHLAKCTQKSWLGDDRSQELLDLTKARLQQLQVLKATMSDIFDFDSQHRTRLNIFIVETEPVKFMSALLAGIIAKVDVFICNPNWQESEWYQVLKLAKPDIVFADPKNSELTRLIKVGDRFAVDEHIFHHDIPNIMIPTGGTSGKIKFAIHNLSTLTASVIGFCDYFATKTVNSFCILPLYHVSGLMQFFRSFLTQGKLHIISYSVLKQGGKVELGIQDFFISLVPTQLQFLLNSQPLWLTKFQTILLGGAPAMRSLLDRARELKISLAPTYGMTETASQVITLKPDDFLKGNNSSGKILSHAQVTILNNAQDVTNKEQIGLIQIKADSLCLGYYPQLFSEAEPLVTDDLGWFDQQGYLYLVGRNSQTIITGGEKVFPTEVEAAILATKLVREVCVIGIQNWYWGQIVTALYIPRKSDLDCDLIKQQISARISKYKHPKYWIKIDRIPHSDRGKIDYQQVELIAQNWLKQQT